MRKKFLKKRPNCSVLQQLSQNRLTSKPGVTKDRKRERRKKRGKRRRKKRQTLNRKTKMKRSRPKILAKWRC